MTRIESEDFFNIRIRENVAGSPTSFHKCSFKACSVAVLPEADYPIRLENFVLDSCSVTGGGLRGAWLRDCSASDLHFGGFVQILGCIFENVSISGRMKQLMISDTYSFVTDGQKFRSIKDAAYASATYTALDISGLTCADLDIRGIPARLIRIDEDSHFVVSRESLATADWRSIDFSGTTYEISLSLLQDSDWEDIVLSLPTGTRAPRSREVLAALRANGLVASHVQPASKEA